MHTPPSRQRTFVRGWKIAAISMLSLAVLSVAWNIFVLPRCTRTDHSMARAQIKTLGEKIDEFRSDTGRLPLSLKELTWPNGLGPYARDWELTDPWQRPVYYRADDDGKGFVLFSLGRDGRLGGEDDAEDVQFESSTKGA